MYESNETGRLYGGTANEILTEHFGFPDLTEGETSMGGTRCDEMLPGTSTREVKSAWDRMLRELCECHVHMGVLACVAEKYDLDPNTHEPFCPAAKAERYREEIAAEAAR